VYLIEINHSSLELSPPIPIISTMNGLFSSNRAWPSLVLCIGLLFGACDRPAPLDEPTTPPGEGSIVHVVLFWLNPATREEGLAAFEDAPQRLAAIPGVDAVVRGVALPDERPMVDSSFDLGFVMHFSSEANLRAYQGHPAHHQLVEELIRPYVERTLIYDIQHTAP